MRYAHDHPRTWADLAVLLSVEDATAFRAFAVALSVVLETANPVALEDLYAAWCADPTVSLRPAVH